ncbi:uncharacterized protein LOC141551652 [Sminthopsis crassicaudata]|uniref:uncharacterized protein LOC141551652 n=1 Tax=Sminthopsis crassicaudata TaxID=9301 RepID=UPI003D69BD20
MLTPAAPLGPQAAMPLAEKAPGPSAAGQDRPSRGPHREGVGAENQPPMGCAPDAPQGADPGPSPVWAHPSSPKQPSAAGPQQPPLENCGAACSGTLQVVLCNHSLWLTFHRQQNEMRLSRPGRAMFPFLAYHIRGMDPRARYRVFVDMVRVDQHHWRYEEAGWAPGGVEESHVPGNQVYAHPDSPNTGAHWMGREIAFKMLKLSNEEPAGRSAPRALRLRSQHRYRPRLHVEEVACGDQEAPGAPSRSHVFSFPETEFIAVTAYRNRELIRLKIEHNPYARAFRTDAPSAGALSAGQPPGPAAAAPSSEAAPDPAGQRPVPRERQARDREIWPGGTLTDSEAAAPGERAPKKRRLSPGPSGSPAMSSARPQRAAQAQRLPAPEASAKASPAAAAERPGGLLGTEEAAVQGGNSAIPAACWAMQQPQQPLHWGLDCTPSSLQTSTAPLAASYGFGLEGLLDLLQEPTLPAEPSQDSGGDSRPSLPLHPVPGAHGEPTKC